MTREKFIQRLDKDEYLYKIEGDKIVVTYKWGVDLSSIKSLPPGVQFNNKWYVRLESLVGKDGFEDWKGNIKGIDSKRLLNFMISKGVFEK